MEMESDAELDKSINELFDSMASQEYILIDSVGFVNEENQEGTQEITEGSDEDDGIPDQHDSKVTNGRPNSDQGMSEKNAVDDDDDLSEVGKAHQHQATSETGNSDLSKVGSGYKHEETSEENKSQGGQEVVWSRTVMYVLHCCFVICTFSAFISGTNLFHPFSFFSLLL